MASLFTLRTKAKQIFQLQRLVFLWLLSLLSRVSQYRGPYFNLGTVKSQVHLRTETEMSHESLQNRLLTPEALQNNSAQNMSKIRRTGEEERGNNFAK